MKPNNLLTIALAWIISAQLAFGTLTATVTPGYQFADGEIPAIYTLNQLGMPSILISGTVDGTTGLTPGSVNGALLSDSVVDGITLDYNAASPRAIEVAAGGINTNQINIGLFGGGVFGGGGAQIALVYDTNYFQLATNSIADTNTVSPSIGVPDTNNVVHPFPMLTLVAGSITDANIGTNAQVQVTKLQTLGSNAILVGNPGATNTPAALGLPFVLNNVAIYFTNYVTNLTIIGTNLSMQPIYTTNYVTNVTSQVNWTMNLQQVTTNIPLPAVTTGTTTSPNTYTIPHFFGELPTYVHGYLTVLGANVVTTNIVGSVTNYFTNAPNITSQFIQGGAIDWRDVYFATNVTGGPSGVANPIWNSGADLPLFTYTADTNYVYVTQAGRNQVSLSIGAKPFYWHAYTNAPTSGVFVPVPLTATNFQLNVVIRY